LENFSRKNLTMMKKISFSIHCMIFCFSLCLLPHASKAQSTASAGDTIYVDDPFIPNLMEVENWISSTVKNKKIGYCYKTQKSRPEGYTIATNDCATGDVERSGLCYTPCPTGYSEVGGVCYEPCPLGYTDAGICWREGGAYAAPPLLADCPSGYVNSVIAQCHRPYSSFRHPSMPANCPPGYTNMGLTCTNWDTWHTIDLWNNSSCPTNYWLDATGLRCYYNCSVSYTGYTNIGDYCARDALSISLDYATCPAGYHKAIGITTCEPNCKHGFHNFGLTCFADSLTYPRYSFTNPGHGHLCPEGYVRDASNPLGYCYRPCPSGYYGELGTCYQNCPSGWTICGVGCARDGLTCASETFGQVYSVLVVAANIVSMGLTTSVTSSGALLATSIKIGSKTFSSTTKWGGAFIKVIKNLQSYQQFSPQGVLQQVTIVKRMKNKLMPWTWPPDLSSATTPAQIRAANLSYKSKCNYRKYKIASVAHEDIQDLKQNVSEDFVAITSQEVNDIINANYDPVEADFIKQYYSTTMLSELQATSGFEIAKDALSTLALADPTGIAALVDSYTHPICGDLNLSFPAKPTIIYGSGVPNAGVGADGNYYVNTDANLPEDANTMYGPKKNGAWPEWTPNY
jgi:hypothetical protein